jgi:hypothetical protein
MEPTCDDLQLKRLKAAALLKSMGDEVETRKFPGLVEEWKDEIGINSSSRNGNEAETLYWRLLRQASEYITSWTFLESVYVPRTDNFLNPSE